MKTMTIASNNPMTQEPEWLTPEEEAELEEDMFQLGMRKYGMDETTAREWAHAFCSDDEDTIQAEAC